MIDGKDYTFKERLMITFSIDRNNIKRDTIAAFKRFLLGIISFAIVLIPLILICWGIAAKQTGYFDRPNDRMVQIANVGDKAVIIFPDGSEKTYIFKPSWVEENIK